MKLHENGMPPLDEPVLAAAVEARLRSERVDRSLAHPTRFRCSDANKCARQIAFSSVGVPKDVQYSREALLAFAAGDAYHDIAQEAAVLSVDARTEAAVDWTPLVSLSGHADLFYPLGQLKRLLPADHPILAHLRERGAKSSDVVCGEIKSMAGFGFRIAVGTASGKEPPGPKVADVLQCALYGLSPQLGARWLHILYIDKDRNLTAEWIIGVDEPMAHLDGRTPRELVEAEIARLNGIAAQLDAGDLPARLVPGFGLVLDPPAADTRDDPWNCRYCSWPPTCAGLSAEVEPGWVAAFISTKQGEAA